MTTLPEANARFVFARVYRAVAFGFGSGLIRPAPGTWGSLVALPLYALLYWLGLSPLMVALLCVPLFLYGCHACGLTCRDLGVPDFGGVVWDEIVAMLLVLAVAPMTLAG